jgi:asparagine synthase (glutamine-hydrolysing)
VCGIAGFVTSGSLGPEAAEIVERMTSAISHRGPDGSGQWLDVQHGVALGHRRLSIIDLSMAGHQPMASTSGRFMLIFYGEIYNHVDLRMQLESESRAPDWKGHSDTEVLLACIDVFGVRGALERLNGMFAIAVWDQRDKVLTIARDRAGEKPLYYGRQGDTIVFASELKAIAANPAFERVIDRAAVAAFMRFGYVPTPMSIWQGIRKLPAAHLVEIRSDGSDPEPPSCYWDLASIATRGAADPFADTPALVNDLDTLLRDAVQLRMQADVPLGTFLSGGIDSSLVTAMMQAQSPRPVRTFSIGFGARGYDESGYARAVAEHLGTDHRELRISAADARAVLPMLPSIWDEPFADSSQIPTYLVSSLARRDVAVALSGDGGDELFAGYNRHVLGARIWETAGLLPKFLRRGIAAALDGSVTGNAFGGMAALTGIGGKVAGIAERLPKISAIVGADTPAEFYAALVSQFRPGANPVIGAQDLLHTSLIPNFADFRNTMLFLDTQTYLPDDILTKVDRATMAVSLEGRIPFLDYRVIEFAWRVPLSAKIRNGRGKYILRQVLNRYFPADLFDRPKAGFAVPVGEWLMDSLQDWAESLLDPALLRAQGFLDADKVGQTWARFLQGEKSLLSQVWCVLMFQAWLSEHQTSTAAPAWRYAA